MVLLHGPPQSAEHKVGLLQPSERRFLVVQAEFAPYIDAARGGLYGLKHKLSSNNMQTNLQQGACGNSTNPNSLNKLGGKPSYPSHGATFIILFMHNSTAVADPHHANQWCGGGAGAATRRTISSISSVPSEMPTGAGSSRRSDRWSSCYRADRSHRCHSLGD